ncbi:hypothetical protein VNO77_02224 [Canavalia gladiata]|uniref:GDSL esterase/lipase n=1 Tax=Canavalia gladiata TaxID=3824 RepID=A0AAN9MTD1_CANGL
MSQTENRNFTFPAVIAFGDSILDTGNNNYIKTLFKANFKPYWRRTHRKVLQWQDPFRFFGVVSRGSTEYIQRVHGKTEGSCGENKDISHSGKKHILDQHGKQ